MKHFKVNACYKTVALKRQEGSVVDIAVEGTIIPNKLIYFFSATIWPVFVYFLLLQTRTVQALRMTSSFEVEL